METEQRSSGNRVQIEQRSSGDRVEMQQRSSENRVEIEWRSSGGQASRGRAHSGASGLRADELALLWARVQVSVRVSAPLFVCTYLRMRVRCCFGCCLWSRIGRCAASGCGVCVDLPSTRLGTRWQTQHTSALRALGTAYNYVAYTYHVQPALRVQKGGRHRIFKVDAYLTETVECRMV